MTRRGIGDESNCKEERIMIEPYLNTDEVEIWSGSSAKTGAAESFERGTEDKRWLIYNRGQTMVERGTEDKREIIGVYFFR